MAIIRRVKNQQNLSPEDVLFCLYGSSGLVDGDRVNILFDSYLRFKKYIYRIWEHYIPDSEFKRPWCFWYWEGHYMKRKKGESEKDYLIRENLLNKTEEYKKFPL